MGAALAGKRRADDSAGLARESCAQFEREVAVFHDARRREQARAAGDEDRLGVAVAEGFELAQPSGKHGRDAVERQLGVNAQQALGLARGEMLVGVEAQAALELGQRCGGQGKADGEGVAAKAREEIGAGFDGGEQGNPSMERPEPWAIPPSGRLQR